MPRILKCCQCGEEVPDDKCCYVGPSRPHCSSECAKKTIAELEQQEQEKLDLTK